MSSVDAETEHIDTSNPLLEGDGRSDSKTAFEVEGDGDRDGDGDANVGRHRVATTSRKDSKGLFKKPSLMSQESHFNERLDDESACSLEWINLKYSINTQTFPPPLPCFICCSLGPCRGRACFRVKEKRILNGVSGRASPGNFLAIMGASGLQLLPSRRVHRSTARQRETRSR